MCLPLLAEHITAAEWGELPGHAMAAFQGDNAFLILGLVREQFTPEQNERMLLEMPPPAVEAWKTIGIDAYKATVIETFFATNKSAKWSTNRSAQWATDWSTNRSA